MLNKQNCRYWVTESPRAKHQKPLHSPKVTVWATISAHGIIGPHFFENKQGQSVTVNSDRNISMLRDFLFESWCFPCGPFSIRCSSFQTVKDFFKLVQQFRGVHSMPTNISSSYYISIESPVYEYRYSRK